MSAFTETTQLSNYETFASSEHETRIPYKFQVPSPTADNTCDENESCILYDSSTRDQGVWSNRSDKEDTSNLTSVDRSRGCHGDSRLVYTDYGEPIKAQNVVIDFTPQEGIDDDQDQMKKCADFWKLLEKYPNLEKLKVGPEPRYTLNGDSEVQLVVEAKDSHVGSTSKQSARHWLEKDWMMNTALRTDMRKMQCDFVSDGHSETQTNESRSEKARKMYSRRGLKYRCKCKSIEESKQLCKEMDAWDATHLKPKSLAT